MNTKDALHEFEKWLPNRLYPFISDEALAIAIKALMEKAEREEQNKVASFPECPFRNW